MLGPARGSIHLTRPGHPSEATPGAGPGEMFERGAAPYRPRPPPARSDSPGVYRGNRSRKGTRGEQAWPQPALSPVTLIGPGHAESVEALILPVFWGGLGLRRQPR